LVGTFLGLMLIFRGSDQEVVSSTSPDFLQLSDENCERACWLGIEPGVTTRDEAHIILENANVDFEFVELQASGGIYNLFLSADDDDVGAISVLDDGQISQIILPLDACISYVVENYGIPPEVQESGIYITLLYPEPGLVFNVNLDDQTRVASVFLTSELVFEANFSGGSLEYNWDDFKDRFAGTCEDNLSA